MTPAQGLAWHHLRRRSQPLPQAVPPAVRAQLQRELALIAECQYEMYFLTVHDVVLCAQRGRSCCQGRGSAAEFGGVLLPGRAR